MLYIFKVSLTVVVKKFKVVAKGPWLQKLRPHIRRNLSPKPETLNFTNSEEHIEGTINKLLLKPPTQQEL